jgi:hypothetical protein
MFQYRGMREQTLGSHSSYPKVKQMILQQSFLERMGPQNPLRSFLPLHSHYWNTNNREKTRQKKLKMEPAVSCQALSRGNLISYTVYNIPEDQTYQ